jgi:hypothetical protein
MSGSPCIQCRVSPEIKARLHAAAEQQQVTESVLLKRLLGAVLLSSETSASQAVEPIAPAARNARAFVRLRPEDRVLLRERAASCDMAPATYASIFLRTHLRRVAPFPERLLVELKVTRHIAAGHQITRVGVPQNNLRARVLTPRGARAPARA